MGPELWFQMLPQPWGWREAGEGRKRGDKTLSLQLSSDMEHFTRQRWSWDLCRDKVTLLFLVWRLRNNDGSHCVLQTYSCLCEVLLPGSRECDPRNELAGPDPITAQAPQAVRLVVEGLHLAGPSSTKGRQ